MAVVRTIVAALVALAVALTPVIAGAVVVAKPADAMTTDASAPMHDCDHAMPGHHPMPGDDCASIAACAVKCFNYTGTVLPDPSFPPRPTMPQPTAASDAVPPSLGHPPFRPPRV